MRSNGMRVLVTGIAAATIGIYAEKGFSGSNDQPKNDPVSVAAAKGIRWLVSVQGKDGGWGQDGGETTYVRQGERLESNGNDAANTAVAALALLHTGNTPVSGEYRESLQRAVRFLLEHVEQSPVEGLAVTNLTGTQIQRKLGPYIDTFLTSKLLAELDGSMGDARANARVRQSLQKCVAKIEKNQLKDGSWNYAGGWAPILGTSMASQSLFVAQKKGVAVSNMALAKVDAYTQNTSADSGAAYSVSGSGGGVGVGTVGGVAGGSVGSTYASVPPARTISVDGRASTAASGEVSAAAAGVPLYKRAQELEQLSRTEGDRAKNAAKIKDISRQLANPQFATGFGSMGGEEFFSYLNVSDSLHRAGGPEWEKWNHDIKDKILKLQNEDGTWAGHHCITGRVAVTSAAILTLLADRESVVLTSSAQKSTVRPVSH
jgi:hypothetical protein